MSLASLGGASGGGSGGDDRKKNDEEERRRRKFRTARPGEGKPEDEARVPGPSKGRSKLSLCF